MYRYELTVSEEGIDQPRVDAYLSAHGVGLPRSQLKTRITRLEINDRPAKLSKSVVSGDRILVEIDDPPPVTYRPEDIPLDIIYEDEQCLVINKPRGMVVHPAAGNRTGTLVQAILYHLGKREERYSEEMRPGVVHRLDKDTSGVLIAAKTTAAQEFLAGQFKDRTTHKRYYAVVKGRPAAGHGTIDTGIRRDPTHRKRFVAVTDGGKRAITHYRVLYQGKRYAFVSLGLETGRTHQLRVHMKSIGTPILGDQLYSRREQEYADAPLMLHAYRLEITIPGENRPRVFRAPFAEEYRTVLREITRSR